MSEEQTVTYELEGEIALVGLNRPDKRNCFNPTVMKQLREAIDRAGEEAKCGIIFGHGDNFCAGLDLRWAAENWKTGRSERLPFPFNRNTYFEAMARGNIPFIAALHGAIGFTDEHDIGLYLKRAMLLSSLYGNAAAQRRRYVAIANLTA